MKIIKYIGIGLLAIIGVTLVTALFVSNEVVYEKSISINAPIDSVWANTNSLAAMDKWSPWVDLDPNMKKSITGTDGTIGAMSAWESDNDKVGKGSQTITKIEKPTLFEADLKFYTPYESEAVGYVILAQEGEGTKATWGFKSVMPYPFNVSKLFMSMENMMGDDWTKGLNKLKEISEK